MFFTEFASCFTLAEKRVSLHMGESKMNFIAIREKKVCNNGDKNMINISFLLVIKHIYGY